MQDPTAPEPTSVRPRRAQASPAELGSRSTFDPSPGTAPERVAGRFRHSPPAVPIGGTYVAGWALLSAVFALIGLLLTQVVLDTALGARDAEINRWMAEHRTPTLDRITSWATFIANTLPVVAVVVAACLVLLALRHWREAVFLAGALLLEVTVFLTANTLADRPRPDVPRLDSTPSTGSFPSGHAAATLALWAGLAIIVNANTRHRVLGVLAWLVAVVLAPLVAFARVYRGMHHLTDVLVGLALGVGALVVSLFAVRVASAVVTLRKAQTGQTVPARASGPISPQLPTEVAP